MTRTEKPVVCIFAKPPDTGKVKTRLIPCLGEDGARDLAKAFLEDTVAACRGQRWARCVLATTFPHGKATADTALELPIWDQGSGDLGARMERVLRRALEDASCAIAIGTDSPGLPADRLVKAASFLKDHDAVLGPSEDGGFYLLGLNRCPEGLLEDLPWSQADTCEKTLARLEESGFKVALVEPWFDVDRPEDVTRLFNLLEAGKIEAPATQKICKALRRPT